MKQIEVLGPGCAKCEKLYQRVEEAIRDLAVECDLKKVVDISRIVEAGVLMTPALVVDGEVKLSGRVPDVQEIKTLLA
jgi:small redox-active disulfide protein 2